MKYYRATAFTKKGRFIDWVADVEGDNLKDAKERAKALWHRDMHLFDFKVRLLRDDEEFSFHSWTMNLSGK